MRKFSHPFKEFKEGFLDKELVPKDDFWEKECEKVYEDNKRLQTLLTEERKRKTSRRRKKDEELNKEFDV